MQRFSSVSFIFIVILVCIASLLGLGCASGGQKPVGAQATQKSEDLPGTPSWYTEVPDDPNYLFASTTSSSKDLQMAVNKAAQEGRVQIAQQLQSKVSGLMKQYMSDTGIGEDSQILSHSENVSKTVVSESLTGCKINKQEIKREGTLYRAYVQMMMSFGDAKLGLRDKIKNDQLLFQQFKASQAYQDLDKETEKYEEWKKQQNQ